jgi:hypothetical protein
MTRFAVLFLAAVAGAQALPDPPKPCVAPSRLSYLSPVIKDQCGHVNGLSAGLQIAGGVENVVNFGSGVYEAKQGFAGSGPLHNSLSYFVRHPAVGSVETIVSQLASNIAANHGARHHANEHRAHIESAVLLAARVAGTILQYRAYSHAIKNGGH